MINLKVPALLAIAFGLGGCVVPIDDGRYGDYRRSGYSSYAPAPWRDEPQRYGFRQHEEQRFDPRGDRQRYDQRY